MKDFSPPPPKLPTSPLPAVLRPIGRLASLIYGRAVQLRNRKFDAADRNQAAAGGVVRRLALPVLSVGNLSVGGTGKTPMVQWICRLLLSEGHRPLIAMRGYKAGGGGKSDEQIEHEERLPEVPVIADPARAEAVQAFLAGTKTEYDCCVLDDGFQHRQLGRDLDLVLIDATRSPFEDRLLPAGFLREPVKNLARADAIILTGADLRDEDRLDLLRIQIGKQHGKQPLALFRHAWTGLRVFEDGEEKDEIAVGQLARRRLFVFCGIAHPQRFFDQVELYGGRLLDRRALGDHAEYEEQFLARLIRDAEAAGADAIVTTEKDWVKLRESAVIRAAGKSVAFLRPRLVVEAIEGEQSLRDLILSTVRCFDGKN